MHPDTGVDEISVLSVLALHASKDGTCFPSQGLIADILGRSRPWVCKVIARLVELGLVERTHRQRSDGGERSCFYRLVPPRDEIDASPQAPLISTENTRSHHRDSLKTTPEHNKWTHTAGANKISHSSAFTLLSPPEQPPEDWQPSDADLLWAIGKFPDANLQMLTERFVLRCRAKGYRFRSLSDGWRSWIADDIRALAAQGGVSKRRSGGSGPSAAHVKFEAWACVARRASGDRYAA